MNSMTSLCNSIPIAVITSIAFVGCVSQTYPPEITHVQPYPSQKQVSPVQPQIVATTISEPVAISPVPPSPPVHPVAAPMYTPPPPTTTSVSRNSADSGPSAPVTPVAEPASVVPPIPTEKGLERPATPAVPAMDLKTKIESIQSLRKQGVLTQDESDRLILRAVEMN